MQRIVAQCLGIVPKPIVKKVSTRYIAGAHLYDAIRTIRALNEKGVMATVDVLGEFVHSSEQAQASKSFDMKVLNALKDNMLDANLSIKLTSLGLKIDFEQCCTHVKEILRVAAGNNNFVRLDMEDSSCTDLTLAVYRRMREEGFTNLGVVLQAYMRRSASDIDTLPAVGLNVRLCKGIYKEPAEIAFQEREEVRNNYTFLLRKLLDKGAYVGVATHDEALIRDADAEMKRRGLSRDAYEFQMLLGVREDRRAQLVRDGIRMRVYVPFGDDWYGYSIRRLKENPQMAMYVIKGIFSAS